MSLLIAFCLETKSQDLEFEYDATKPTQLVIFYGENREEEIVATTRTFLNRQTELRAFASLCTPTTPVNFLEVEEIIFKWGLFPSENKGLESLMATYDPRPYQGGKLPFFENFPNVKAVCFAKNGLGPNSLQKGGAPLTIFFPNMVQLDLSENNFSGGENIPISCETNQLVALNLASTNMSADTLYFLLEALIKEYPVDARVGLSSLQSLNLGNNLEIFMDEKGKQNLNIIFQRFQSLRYLNLANTGLTEHLLNQGFDHVYCSEPVVEETADLGRVVHQLLSPILRRTDFTCLKCLDLSANPVNNSEIVQIFRDNEINYDPKLVIEDTLLSEANLVVRAQELLLANQNPSQDPNLEILRQVLVVVIDNARLPNNLPFQGR